MILCLSPCYAQVARTARNAHSDESIQAQVQLQDRTQVLSLTQRQGATALRLIRLYKILEVAHELVRSGRTATQREIYYRLKCPDVFRTAADVNEAIQDVVAVLMVPRSALGIQCSSKGAVAGRLLLHRPTSAATDCTSLGKAGFAIPGDMHAVQAFTFQSDARSAAR